MFYKEIDGVWKARMIIHFTDGVCLSSSNRISKDGWEWHDEPPSEYLEYINSNQ